MGRLTFSWVVGVAAMLAAAGANLPAAPTAGDATFFESKVRPILADHCYSCHSHSAEKIKGALLLDSAEALNKGGANGAVVVPGEPDKSKLIIAVRYKDEDLQMPPKGKKLSTEQVAILEQWVKSGAVYPATKSVVATMSLAERAQKHWAFKPVSNPPVPAIKNVRWAQNPVDRFVLQKLEARGMAPAPRADRRTLIRRLYYDLTGLPPTPQAVEQFINDKSGNAVEKVVDELLASPRYGERWGRYWLDVARYADTKGYVFEEERRYPNAYTFRDYVVRSLNEDVPFDRFLTEQLAADRLNLGEDKRPLAALGYLTLGRRFLNNQPDIIDDRIDVVCRGMLGLTVTCARCHDHKYDPLTMKDYYSLYGVFASSVEPPESPLLGIIPKGPEYEQYLKERKARTEESEKFKTEKENEAMASLRIRGGEYLLAAIEGAKLNDSSKMEALARQRKLDPGVVSKWASSLEKWTKEDKAFWSPLAGIAKVEEKEFKKTVLTRLEKLQTATNPAVRLLAGAITADPPANLKALTEIYGELFKRAESAWQALSTNNPTSKPVGLADVGLESIRQSLYNQDSPAYIERSETRRLFDVPSGQKVRALQRKLDELEATHLGAPPRAMAIQDAPTPHNGRIFLRGNQNNPGPEVPRRFVEALSKGEPKPFKEGSGRLELAKAITSPDNPLTARVIANRIWMHHFGSGLVRTPSDFGTRADLPTHPELLDYLASSFIKNGWSQKKLHKLIVMSATYQQSCEGNPRYEGLDPNNQFLWHMNRQRLDFEAMRDSLLAVSGKLDDRIGGHPVEITEEPFPTRRTLYGFVERQNLPGLFRTFDFASPDSTSPQRFATMVPQQALFLLNNPFVIEQARALLARSASHAKNDDERVEALYRILFQRKPEPEERKVARAFLARQDEFAKPAQEASAWQYGYGKYDEAKQRVTQFSALTHFKGMIWQAGTDMPDKELGFVNLSARGGHPDRNPDRAAIRRWVSPVSGTIRIQGTLGHDGKVGDGVRGRIVSSSHGLLGEYIAFNSKTNAALESVEVAVGDVIDFVVDCRESLNTDSFTWAPAISLVRETKPLMTGIRRDWNARADFSGPLTKPPMPLNGWEKYAQVLLLSNEMLFVD